MSKLDEILKNEASLEVKIAALEKGASSSTVPQISIEELTKLKAELDERRKLLSQEVGDLFASVEEESSTYSTFQKIKEKVRASIEEYNASIKKMETELKEVGSEVKLVSSELDEGLKKMRGKIDEKELSAIVTAAAEVEGKRKLLDDIAESLEALTAASESINRKLNLLSKEAQLLSLKSQGVSAQSSGITRPKSAQAASSGEEATEPEVKQQLSLTKNEVVEFDKKREELRNLIKKLWEQS
jgi:recombinational DNA repair ATPase RecF